MATRFQAILEAEGLNPNAVADEAGKPSQTAYRVAETGVVKNTTAALFVRALNILVERRCGVDPGYRMGEVFGCEPLPELPKRPASEPEGAAA